MRDSASSNRKRSSPLVVELLEDRLAPAANPLAMPDTYVLQQNQTLTVPATLGVLANDTSAGAQMRAALLGAAPPGTFSLAPDGSFTYTPPAGFTGDVEFVYHATDTASGGRTVYTVDIQTDELIAIDRITGAITVVGAIGHDMHNVDLTFLGNTLYALTSNSPDLFGRPGFTLVAIDVYTGAKISAVAVNTIGTAFDPPLLIADGLTALDGRLLIAYDTFDLTPSRIGELNPATGAITFLADYETVGQFEFDFDGIGSAETGQLVAVNTEGFSGDTKQVIIYRLTLPPSPSIAYVNDELRGNNAIFADLGFSPFGAFVVDPGSRTLHRYALDTLFLQPSVPLAARATFFNGTAWGPAPESLGKVTIHVNADPAANPLASADTYLIQQGQALNVPAALGLLANDDSNGTVIQASLFGAAPPGTFNLAPDGSFTYTPPAGFSGTVEFVYHATDTGNNGSALYAVDTNTDQLVQIDPTTGAVRVIGDIGHDMFNVDLTYLDGVIYALAALGPVSGGGLDWKLIGIDVRTGAKVSEVDVNTTPPEGPLLTADGLAVADGKLLIVYDSSDGLPTMIGELNPSTGDITHIVELETAVGGEFDIDGLGDQRNGILYTVNTERFSDPLKQIIFTTLDLSRPRDGIFRDYLLTDSIVDDLAVTPFGLFALDWGRRELHRLNLDTLNLERSVAVGTAAGRYVGLAWAPATESLATVTIRVNAAPTAAADPVTVPEDSADNFLDVLDNDTVEPDETPTVTAVSDADHGTVTIAPGGVGVLYTPDPDYFGGDTFTYTISDGNGGTDTATVTITFANVNDDPTADDDPATVQEDSEDNLVAVLANDSFDPDLGETLTVIAVGDPAHGTAIIAPGGSGVLYTPDPDFFGTDTFSYTVSDGNGGTDTATVTVTVNSVNDDPTADADAATVSEDSSDNPIAVLNNDSFAPDVGETLTVTGVSDPAHGTAVVAAGGSGVLYTPDPDFFGTDTFTYTIDDGNGGTATATVTVTVNNVNDNPSAAAVVANVLEDTSENLIPVLDDASISPDVGETLKVIAVSAPDHGTAVVAPGGDGVLYTPDPDFFGTDTFTYTIDDGNGGTATGTVTVSVANRGEPSAVIAVGTDAGVTARVRLLDGTTRALIREFTPYHSYNGGVRVALGDVNNDGVEDVITSSGGTIGHIKVFDGRTGAEFYSFMPFETFPSSLSVGAGDLDGDGFDDIVVGVENGPTHVKAYSGRTGQLFLSFFAYSGFGGGVRVAVGDLDGDGDADVATVAGPGGNGHVKGFDGRTMSLIHSYFAYANFSGEVGLAIAFLDNGPSVVTVAMNPVFGGHVRARGLGGVDVLSYFAPTAVSSAARIGAGDVNDDGVEDLFVTTGAGASPTRLLVQDPTTLAVLDQIFAFGTEFNLGAFVA